MIVNCENAVGLRGGRNSERQEWTATAVARRKNGRGRGGGDNATMDVNDDDDDDDNDDDDNKNDNSNPTIKQCMGVRGRSKMMVAMDNGRQQK